ncbi:histone-lysine N-methyltransferase SETMAR [Trichonephila clavipes]|nr:histone-lysine N-methyltransferase SETMAR [Trichonephila clavipes]
MEVNKEKIRYILQFFFDKGENANQVAEIVNGVNGADTVTANCMQLWFCRFRSGIFVVKVAPRPSSKISAEPVTVGSPKTKGPYTFRRDMAQNTFNLGESRCDSTLIL